jgi:hypothetical protein
MNGYSFLHFYIQKTNLYNTQLKKMYSAILKKEADVHLSKLDAIYFFYLIGIEVFSKLFHLMCHLFKSDKK